MKRSKHMPHDDGGGQFQYGAVEAHSIDAGTSDFPPHQFIAPDEARDPMGSDDNEQDAASNDAARAKALSVEVFDRMLNPLTTSCSGNRAHGAR